jgi:hypothetical protein
MTKRLWRVFVTLAAFLVVAQFASSQAVEQKRTLIVNGQSGQVAMLQLNGRSFVDIAAVAQLANGTLGFRGEQIVLTLPAGGANAPAPTPAASQQSNSAFSKGFMTAGIETMSVIREWRSAMANALQNGYPVSANWVESYRGRAAQNLRLASVAASTDADQQAFQLLTNELDNMKNWSDKILKAFKDMDAAKYMSSGALDNDPLFQKILNCAHSLAAMSASGQFQDDGSCH